MSQPHTISLLESSELVEKCWWCVQFLASLRSALSSIHSLNHPVRAGSLDCPPSPSPISRSLSLLIFLPLPARRTREEGGGHADGAVRAGRGGLGPVTCTVKSFRYAQDRPLVGQSAAARVMFRSMRAWGRERRGEGMIPPPARPLARTIALGSAYSFAKRFIR